MKKRILSVAFLFAAIAVQAQVGIGTATPIKSAELAVVSSKRGLIIPNVALTSSIDKTTIEAGNIESLLVYNTRKTNDLRIGFYYWDNRQWNALTDDLSIPEVVINHFLEITKGGDVTKIIRDIVSKTKGNVSYENNTFYYIDDNGGKIEINLEDAIKQHEALTELKYNPSLNQLVYQDENTDLKVIDLNNSSLEYNDVTHALSFTDNKGVLEKMPLSVGRFAFNDNSNEFKYTDEKGDETLIDFNKLAKGTISSSDLIVNHGGNSIFKDVTLIIKPGTANQVLSTSSDGTKVEWIEQTDVVPITTNDLSLVSNKLTSTVNNISSSVDLSEDNLISTKGLTGLSISVEGGLGSTLKDVVLEVTPGTANQVLSTSSDGTKVEWIDQTDVVPVTTNGLSLVSNKLTSTVNNILSSVDLSEDNLISTKGLTGLSISVEGGLGSTLKDVVLEVTPGTANQVLSTSSDGTKVEWIDQTDVVPVTTNNLEMSGNTLTSKVNNVTTTTTIVDSIVNTIENKKEFITTINGVSSQGLDLSAAVKNTQLKYSVTGASDDIKISTTSIDDDISYNIDVKAAMPKFFYMPPIVFDTTEIGTFERNLHEEYLNQFTGFNNPTLIKNESAPSQVPNLPIATDLDYYIIYYDTKVFDELSISDSGVLTYTIVGAGTITSFMTIVFVIK